MNPFEAATNLQDYAESPTTSPEDSAKARRVAAQILTKALGPNAVLTPLKSVESVLSGLLSDTQGSGE